MGFGISMPCHALPIGSGIHYGLLISFYGVMQLLFAPEVSEKMRVLDLPRGKRAVSVQAAKTLGCWVKGMTSFLSLLILKIKRLKDIV